MKEALKDFLEMLWVMLSATVISVICTFLLIFLFWAGFKLIGVDFSKVKTTEVIEQ